MANPTRSRRPLLGSALVLAALLVGAAACSDGIRDSAKENGGSRNASSGMTCSVASGAIDTSPTQSPTTPVPALEQDAAFGARGNPNCNVSLADWCLPNASYGVQLPDIAMCMIFTNKAARFTSPDTLGANFPLTASGAFCESYRDAGSPNQGYLDDLGLCTSTSGYRGSVRVYNTKGTAYGDVPRLLYPNPFLGVGAIQFMPHRQSTGPYVQVAINTRMAPLSAGSAPARPAAQPPFSGSNWQACEGEGTWLTCRSEGGLAPSAWSPEMRYEIGTRPIKLRITNSTTRTNRMTSSYAGRGILVDPNGVGTSKSTPGSIDVLTANATAYVGGYLAIEDGSAEKSWTGQFEIQTLSGVSVPVTVTFKLSFDGMKNESTCIVDNRTATSTFKCNTPTFNNSPDMPILSANITDF